MANNDQENNHTPQISITKQVSVYPKTIHLPTQINISNLDRQCPSLMYMVFFYKPCLDLSNLSTDSVFSSLKNGLEETLSVWYPAAGRLRYTAFNGHGLNKLDIWCNNDGAVLVEAETETKICELGDLSEYNKFNEDLVFKPKFDVDFSDMPLVVAQGNTIGKRNATLFPPHIRPIKGIIIWGGVAVLVSRLEPPDIAVTKFGCGGYSIGVGLSHSLFDGPATFNFLNAWSSNTKMSPQDIIVDQPVHDRGTLLLFKPGNSANNTTKMAAAIEHLYRLIQQKMTFSNGDVNYALGDGKKIDYVFKTFHLSQVMIEKLKKKFLSAGFVCSLFEFLAAHLWKVRTKALAIKSEKMVCLQFAVDIRNKVSPPMPKGFSGNAYVLASIALTAGELEQEDYESLVNKIKEAKNSISNEYVTSYLNALEGPSQGSLPPIDELTLVSDWTRMPFHKIRVLPGEAPCATPVLPPIPQVAYFMQNGDEVRGVNVRIGLLPDILNAFSQDFAADL